MQWESWSAFWHMGGRAWYVWGSYAVCFALIALEVAQLVRTRRTLWQKLRRLAMLESTDTPTPPSADAPQENTPDPV